jgi:hypothetical protein
MPRAGPAGPVTKLEELGDLLNQQQQQQQHAATGSPQHRGNAGLPPPPPMVGEPMDLDEEAPGLTRRASNLRPTSFLAPLLNPRSFKPKTRSIYRDMRPASHASLRHQPSILKQPLSPGESRSLHRPTTPSVETSHNSINLAASRGLLFQQDQASALRSDPNQESELQVELNFILSSRLKVATKYQDRLVYLRAKLKGALIRELSS